MKNAKQFLKLLLEYLIVTVLLVFISVLIIEVISLFVSFSEVESEIIKKMVRITLLFAMISQNQNKVSQEKKVEINNVVHDIAITVGSWYTVMLFLISVLLIFSLFINSSEIIDFSSIYTFKSKYPNILTHLLSVGILTPIYEELLFRDYLYRVENKTRLTFVMLSIIFSLVHADVIIFPMTFIFSVHCFNMREKHGNVITSIVAHVIINSYGVLANYYLQNGLLVFISIMLMFVGYYFKFLIIK